MSHLDQTVLAAHNQRQAELAESNARQKDEAMSDDNKYFFYLRYGRDGSESELMMYYIENGGATGHRQRVAERAAAADDEKPNTPE